MANNYSLENRRYGDTFEDMVETNVMKRVFSSYKPATLSEDKYEGTDCFITVNGVTLRIDITSKASKDNTTWFGKDYFRNETISFGIRRRNAHHVFKRPVLVLLVEREYGVSMDVAVEDLLFKADRVHTRIETLVEKYLPDYQAALA